MGLSHGAGIFVQGSSMGSITELRGHVHRITSLGSLWSGRTSQICEFPRALSHSNCAVAIPSLPDTTRVRAPHHHIPLNTNPRDASRNKWFATVSTPCHPT